MHNTYISPGVVDGQVAHDQAWRRLTMRRPGDLPSTIEETIVHNHAYKFGLEKCTDKCVIYHMGKTGKPHSHPIAADCPSKTESMIDG